MMTNSYGSGRRLAGARLSLVVAATAVAVAGCAAAPDRAPAAPGAGGPVPAIRLDAVTGKIDQLQAWALPRSGKYGIPLRALEAYGYATVVMAQAQPGCHLGWTTLAGIARVESDHARFGGATIAPDGLVAPPIRGVPLNGTAGNAVILDPASKSGHGGYARAMGPFQFIPDTWKHWGVRAGADYQALASALQSAKPVATNDLSGNPDNIDDAALAAGRYLCAAGGDLSTANGWRQAILAYNHSSVYVGQVRSAATGYDA